MAELGFEFGTVRPWDCGPDHKAPITLTQGRTHVPERHTECAEEGTQGSQGPVKGTEEAKGTLKSGSA